MGFKLFRERMGDDLYLRKMKEADEVIETYIFASFPAGIILVVDYMHPSSERTSFPSWPLGGTDEL